MVGDADQHLPQVGFRINTVQFRRTDQAVDRRPSKKEKGQHSRWPRKPPFLLRYLAQVSVTMFRLVTRRSRYSSFSDAFTTSPSFFSFFASAFDSALAVPATVTLWPTWSSSFTVLLRRPHTLPSSPKMENSPAPSPLCKQPVTLTFRLASALASDLSSA